MNKLANKEAIMNDVFEYYKVLNVGVAAPSAEIKKQYRDLAKIWHPDHNKKNDAMEKFQHLSVAYDVLSDDDSRLFYDVFCVAYKKQPAPDMNLLKIYKDISGVESKSLRVLELYKDGKIKKIICSEKEAKKVVLKSLLDYRNYKQPLFDKAINLQMLLHNALAYKLDKNNQMAAIYASQSLEFASDDEKLVIKKWISTLGQPKIVPQTWNYSNLKSYKLLPFLLILVLFLLFVASQFAGRVDILSFFAKEKEISYYQKIEYLDGRQTLDDVELGKVINYPVNIYDANMLYHLKSEVAIMMGPSKEFDVLQQGVVGQTVRVTGQTPDEAWMRVMVDDGQMGFVKPSVLRKGVGNKIPKNSKIIK